MLTKLQKQTLDFIKSFSRKNDYSPILEEIAKHFRVASVGTIHERLQKLKEQGYIHINKNQRRGIELIEQRPMIQIPLLGTIAAGQPIEALEVPSETIAVTQNEIGKFGNYYALRVQGDSMIGDGIFDGDIVIIRKQQMAENGETVVALINNDEVTLKKIFKEKGGFRLQSANPKYKPLFVRNFKIQGKVTNIIRNFS